MRSVKSTASGGLEVRKIDLTFVGTRPSSIGLAFNNFSPITSQIHEPATLQLLGSALLLLGTLRRFRR